MKKLKNNKGVTLIELLVVLAILGVVMIMAVNLFSYSMKSYKNDDVQLQIQQDARHAIQQMSKDVRKSSTLSVVDSGSKLTLTQPGSSTIDFYISNNKLYREADSVKNPLIENAKEIVFIWDDDDKVLTVDLITQKPGTDNQYKISTKLYSRLN